jgi:hypothetical protein
MRTIQKLNKAHIRSPSDGPWICHVLSMSSILATVGSMLMAHMASAFGIGNGNGNARHSSHDDAPRFHEIPSCA